MKVFSICQWNRSNLVLVSRDNNDESLNTCAKLNTYKHNPTTNPDLTPVMEYGLHHPANYLFGKRPVPLGGNIQSVDDNDDFAVMN